MTLSGSFGNQRNHAGIVVLACVFLQAKRFHAHPDKIATRTALLAFPSFCVFFARATKTDSHLCLRILALFSFVGDLMKI
jgi:hypothetical protein